MTDAGIPMGEVPCEVAAANERISAAMMGMVPGAIRHVEEPVPGGLVAMRTEVTCSYNDLRIVLAAFDKAFADTPPPAAAGDRSLADIELLGAQMVLEGKVSNATGALADTSWRPSRSHIEGMRNTMAEALEYVAKARLALRTPEPDSGGEASDA